MSLLERNNAGRERIEQTIEEKLEFEDGVEAVIDNAVYIEELEIGSAPGLYYHTNCRLI